MSKRVTRKTNELHVINDNCKNKSSDICDITCFSAHKVYKVNCVKHDCKSWIENSEFQNCAINAAEDGPQTLQVIGDTFGVTRMRICQIEKTVLKKIASKNPRLLEFI